MLLKCHFFSSTATIQRLPKIVIKNLSVKIFKKCKDGIVEDCKRKESAKVSIRVITKIIVGISQLKPKYCNQITCYISSKT